MWQSELMCWGPDPKLITTTSQGVHLSQAKQHKNRNTLGFILLHGRVSVFIRMKSALIITQVWMWDEITSAEYPAARLRRTVISMPYSKLKCSHGVFVRARKTLLNLDYVPLHKQWGYKTIQSLSMADLRQPPRLDDQKQICTCCGIIPWLMLHD